MARTIKIISSVLLVLFLGLFTLCFFFENDTLLSITITVGVFAYHFIMRLAVGIILNAILKNKVNYNAYWFREKSFEAKLYAFLRVKKWKKYMPTFAPETFNVKERTLEEIASTTCQSEIIHEVIMVLSYLPIFLAIPFGTIGVFIATSILASFVDAIFVIMQRFNRPRLVKLIARKNKNI